MVTPPTPTDGAPEAPHPAPFEQGTRESLQVGKQTALIAATVIAKAHQSNMVGIKKSVDQVREMMRRIGQALANGRLNVKKFRDILNRRRSESRPSGPQASADEPRRDQEKRGPETPSQKDEGKKKQETKGQKSSVDETQASEMVLALSKSLDADGAMALWGLAVQEKGKFPDKIAEIAEGRLRDIDPEMMKVFDESREQGKGRLDSMSDSLASHPKVGADFIEALKSMDEKTQGYKAELQEAKLVNAIEDLQTGQKLKGEPPLSSSEMKEHFQKNPDPTSGHYSEELLDKVTAEKYSPSKGVDHARNILRAEESERKNADQKSPDSKEKKEQPHREEQEKGKSKGRGGEDKDKKRSQGKGEGKGKNGPNHGPKGKPKPKQPNQGNNKGPENKNRNNNEKQKGRGR